MTLSEYLGLLPKQWFAEDGSARVLEDEFRSTIAGVKDFFTTKTGRKLRGDWRQKLQSFAVRNAYVPEGMTNIDVQGSYVVGTRPRDTQDLLKQAKRTVGEQIYARGLVYGTNQVLKEIGFKHLPSEDYADRASALIALECDSLSKKGPYDNGPWDQAIKTVDGVLTNSIDYKPLPEYLYDAWERGLNKRQSEYKQHVQPGLTMHVEGYVEYMRSRGLARTMRGFPFYASGASKLREHHYDTTMLMFSSIAGYRYTDTVRGDYVGKVSVDEFIQLVLVHLFNELKLPMSSWYNLYHAIIIPISRDQGSPFEVTWNKRGDALEFTGHRKDRKYRLVTPISAYVQAALIMATRSLVQSAPATEGRIGLQDPDTNDVRMNDFIRRAQELERVIISTDFSSYDSTLSAQLMGSMCAMYSTLFDDPFVQDALRMAGVVATQKIMILPTSVNEAGRPYQHFIRELLPQIKGDRRFTTRKVRSQLQGSPLKSKLKAQEDDVDYMCQAFYVCKGYLPSGLIITNTLGSDCTLLLARDLVPRALEVKGVFPVEPDAPPYHAIGSGDDCAQEVPKSVYDRVGYDKLLEYMEEAFSECNMVVNAKKQLKIKLKGYPLIDFLQQVYTQYYSDEFQHPYHKFLRQAPSLPYKERFSQLYQTTQWVIVWGKLDSALCEENLEFAARTFAYAGIAMNTDAKKKSYRPPVPSSWYASRNELFYNADFGIDKSTLGGLEQFVGLVKNYGQNTLASIVKYDFRPDEAVRLAAEFDSELETRAPHRTQLAEQVFSALGGDFAKANDEDGRMVPGKTYVSLVPEFTRLLEEYSGVVVHAQALDQPKIGGAVRQDGEESTEDDQPDADDYELS